MCYSNLFIYPCKFFDMREMNWIQAYFCLFIFVSCNRSAWQNMISSPPLICIKDTTLSLKKKKKTKIRRANLEWSYKLFFGRDFNVFPDIPAVSMTWLASLSQNSHVESNKPKKIVSHTGCDPLLAQKQQPLTDEVKRWRKFPEQRVFFSETIATVIPSRWD